MSARIVGSVLASLSLLAGCGDDREPPRTWLEDHFVSDGAEGDELHSPYVAGTRLMLTIQTTSRLITSGRRLDVTSDDPSVLRIDRVERRSVEATAIAPGTTTVRVVDVATGDELTSEEVEVRAPTRVEVYPFVAQTRYVRDEDAMREDATLHVLAGSSAGYYVRYFDGETALAGSGVLETSVETTPAGEGGEGPSPRVLRGISRLEWLLVLAGDAGGLADVTLRTGERDLGVLRVESVPPEAFATLELQDREAEAQEGAEIAVRKMMVHAHPESGRVTSSTVASCSVACGGRGGARVAGVALVEGVLARRRRVA